MIYRDFAFPLNVFMLILTEEQGDAQWLHYGVFEDAGESLARAQERAAEVLWSALPPPPARLLDVGSGLGTAVRRLTEAGYDAEGVTPSEAEIAAVRARHGDRVRVHHARFEDFAGDRYDAVLFQESSQYVDSDALFERAARLAPLVVVMDEFALRPLDEEGALHSRDAFIAAAARHGFRVLEERDLSAAAAPTMAYFTDRIPAYRERLVAELAVTGEQVDGLVEAGARYRARYADGTYGYRLFRLEPG